MSNSTNTDTSSNAIPAIIAENRRRITLEHPDFNPITGQGSVGQRFIFTLPDYPIPTQHLPIAMKTCRLVRLLKRHGSVRAFITDHLHRPFTADTYNSVVDSFSRLRARHDFPFWAAWLAHIKNKDGGPDILFSLNRPQRRLVTLLEQMRLDSQPIRIILLKARQWGGSTAIQIYMAWLQLVHMEGLNSLIVGNVMDASNEVRDMYNRLITAYPAAMLHPIGEPFDPGEPKFTGVGTSPNIRRVPQRNCKIKIGTAEKPDSARGGDYSLIHCTEVGLWRRTEGRTPEDIIQSATSGVLLKPYTLIVYESTAKGVGNFFHREYTNAKEGKSQFTPLFIPWFDIERYALPFASDKEEADFARQLYNGRDNPNEPSDRDEPGRYLWWLWQRGATLQGIHWYINERRKYNDHARMASEYPSDDIEAFANSGSNVFDRYEVEKFRPACRAPRFIGELTADGTEGKAALSGLHFAPDRCGLLWIWEKPETFTGKRVTDRYLTVVDIGGRGRRADWSVIVVFDRLLLVDGEGPAVVAQWYGHIDMDLLAWRAAQVAAYYDNALLVIESNTLETRDQNHDTEGDQAEFILSQIKSVYSNLYARRQSEDDIRQHRPIKYGFHTNVATKPKIISTLIKVVREQLYTERDQRCLDEFLTYEKENGSYNAITGKHDDLLMTRAIGLHIAYYEMPIPRIIDTEAPYKPTSRRAVSEASL